jgi:ribosome-binding factor A
MTRRIEQVNEMLRLELAQLLSRERPMENGLITIIYVKCSPDLRYAKVGFSVLPENLAGSALRHLSRLNSELTNVLKKKLKFKFVPKLKWEIDGSERYVAEIDKIFKNLKDNPHAESL